MKLSVIIPTYKRDFVLVETLESLENQLFLDYEIIVVSQSPAGTELTAYVEKNDKIRYFEQFDKRGAVYNRNLGIVKAKGDILLFLDDDVRPLDKALFSRHVQNYADSDIDAVVGRVTQRDFPEFNKDMKVGFVGKSGQVVANPHGTQRQFVMIGGSGNLSVRRSVLQKLNGFDENFLVGMREDSDLCMRINRNGRLVFDPTAGVHHLNVRSGGMEIRRERTTEERIEWYYQFFHNDILFFLKHCSFWNLPFYILIYKIRPILVCMLWYGKGHPVALRMPWKGMIGGYKTYRKELREKSIWL